MRHWRGSGIYKRRWLLKRSSMGAIWKRARLRGKGRAVYEGLIRGKN
jgi:hypothetical protein